jgi:macrodomain Ter protein organizer (MatP/YcbG family)
VSARPKRIEVTDVVYKRLNEQARQRGCSVSKLIDEALDVAEAKQRAN